MNARRCRKGGLSLESRRLMGRRSGRLAVVALLAAVAAGCGGDGDGDGDGDLYRLEPTRSCLEQQAIVRRTSNKVDVVASTALGGAFRVRFATNEVTVAFGDDLEDAAKTMRAYRRFAPSGAPLEATLRRARNVVLLWGAPPSSEEDAAVGGCLKA